MSMSRPDSVTPLHPKLEEIISQTGKQERNETIYLANIKYGYALKETGDYSGLHFTTVSKAVKSIEAKK